MKKCASEEEIATLLCGQMIGLLKSSRLFPLSYLFQKNQYKCDIVPSLPTGLCGIEPVEHAPVRVQPRIGPFNALSSTSYMKGVFILVFTVQR